MIGTKTRESGTKRKGGLFAPLRNRFFHGKRLDVYHFELETAYGIEMRRLINRHVIGRGVVCGLDVTPGKCDCSVVIGPGLAIDAIGREILVPVASESIEIPRAILDRVCPKRDEDKPDDPKQQGRHRQSKASDDCDPGWLTMSLCYHECEIGGTVSTGGPCGTTTNTGAGLIRESYRIEFTPGRPDAHDRLCSGLIYNRGSLSREELARIVTQGCCDPTCHTCIPLAAIRIDCEADVCRLDCDAIDILVRPVVITNPLIYGVGCFEYEAEREERAEAN